MTGTAHSAAGIGVDLADWQPEAIDTEDVITSQRARQLAATLDLDDEFADGDQLPLHTCAERTRQPQRDQHSDEGDGKPKRRWWQQK
jgi:hypothetical protein